MVGLVCTGMFLTRAVFWAWYPVSRYLTPRGIYPWGFYTVVELVPTMLLFFVLAPTEDRRNNQNSSNPGHGWGGGVASAGDNNDFMRAEDVEILQAMSSAREDQFFSHSDVENDKFIPQMDGFDTDDEDPYQSGYNGRAYA